MMTRHIVRAGRFGLPVVIVGALIATLWIDTSYGSMTQDGAESYAMERLAEASGSRCFVTSYTTSANETAAELQARIDAVGTSNWLVPGRAFIGSLADAGTAFEAQILVEGRMEAWFLSESDGSQRALRLVRAESSKGEEVWTHIDTMRPQPCPADVMERMP